MTAEEKIKRLRKEVNWDSKDMLRLIGEWTLLAEEEDDREFIVDALLEDVEEMDLQDELLQFLISKADFHIKLDNLDDREGCVMIEAKSQVLAEHDQTIAGSKWECPGDMDIAYAMPMDHPGLLEELEKESYIIDDSEYSPPEKLCPHGKNIGSCAACDVAGDLAYDAAREDSRRNF